ncbi:hypothetical protein [Thauera humireducens]|uniref:Uncharacterized protein n=1 Tax=Thauera humireducens TaxID=1134435 RepID=A0A127K3S4_9RHOO|nr:hypothetical protein [Thauera humireducens]AMO36608.1 hypothetical protein AC731_006430 [Thauera humireducens]
MLTFKSFTGINNVLPQERLSPDALTVATNVDAGLTGELRRREGYALAAEGCHKNLFQADGFLLATCDGDLKNVDAGVVLYAGLGSSRVWYAQLPDGRVAWSNDLICGLTDGVTATTWGVPIPPSVGALTELAGDLCPGEYQWQITYVRLADGLEGGPAYSSAPVRVEDGGVFLSGLPVEAGYKINVYLTSHDGGRAFYAGSTTNGLFSFTGKNDDLVLPCRTEFMQPAPAGRCLTTWRNRALVADGNVLYASSPNTAELFDVRRDFKQLVDPITAVIPVDDGIYVGTERELAFLAGDRFDNLVYRRVVNGPVVLGSGVSVRAELVKQGEGAGMGAAALCIADGGIVAGFNGGGVVRMTEGRYKTTVTEVHASFRMRAGIPQYMAIPA